MHALAVSLLGVFSFPLRHEGNRRSLLQMNSVNSRMLRLRTRTSSNELLSRSELQLELSEPGLHSSTGSTRRKAMLRSTGSRLSTTGILSTAALFGAAAFAFLVADFLAIQGPRTAFVLTGPFLISFVATGLLGCYCVPLLAKIKAEQVLRKEGPASHMSKAGTPTMGGIFFIPVGICVAMLATRCSSKDVASVAAATMIFAAIGLLDDASSIFRNHNYGVPGWIKLFFEALVGSWFFFWPSASNRATMLVSLPPPLGPWHIGKWYLPLTAFCFASMANGVNLTDGLDGLASGTAALALTAMATAALPVSPGLGVFGASMAGACVGFLLHNRHRASVFMGDTGSLALGGALAAMASCTGYFLPLFIASGVFVVETVSVICQVAFFRYTKRIHGTGKRLFRMSPFHHHLEHIGFREADIVAGAYTVSLLLGLVAAYVGLKCKIS